MPQLMDIIKGSGTSSSISMVGINTLSTTWMTPLLFIKSPCTTLQSLTCDPKKLIIDPL